MDQQYDTCKAMFRAICLHDLRMNVSTSCRDRSKGFSELEKSRKGKTKRNQQVCNKDFDCLKIIINDLIRNCCGNKTKGKVASNDHVTYEHIKYKVYTLLVQIDLEKE